MNALGFHVVAHRVAAYALAGLIAAVGGILFVWYNGLITPGSVSMSWLINILVIAVLGGMKHPLGAFLGAIVFVLLQTFAIDLIDRERFNLVIGGVFLAIVLFSPDGLLGLWEKLRLRLGPGRALPHQPKETDSESDARRIWMRSALGAAAVTALLGSGLGPAGPAGEDRPAGHARRAVRGRRRRRHARRRARGQAARRRRGRAQDRDHQGLVRRQARRRGQRDAQARRAGQGRHHGRPALGRRGHRGQGLLEDAAAGHLHQRRLGRAGDDAGQPEPELLPLQHRRRRSG